MKGLAKYLKPYAWYMLLTVAIKIVAPILELIVPYLMEQMLDVHVPNSNVRAIYLCGGGMLLCAFGCLFFNILANRMSAYSSGKITQAIRHDLFAKLQSLSAHQMDGLTVSSAESRLTSDTYNVNQMLARLQRMGIRAPGLLIGGIIMMLMMDATLSLVLIALLPIIGVVVYFVTKKSVPLYTKQQTALDRVVRVVQENITGIRVIKALSKTEYEKERFHGVNDELSDIGLKAGTVTGATNPIASGVLRLGLTLVVLVGAFRVYQGNMEKGVIIAFLQYFTMILNAMLAVTRIFVMWSKGEASAKRVSQVLEMPEELKVTDILGKEEVANAPHIEFKDVSFSYTGVGRNLDHLSFRLERGQTLGILGSTGSGKSTVLNLLLRLYDADEGQILIDGQDIRTIPYEDLRKKFGVVFQNDFLAEGTIADNIRFFRDLDAQSLESAAAMAQAEFVHHKEGGMDAEVAVRGNNLSGGQKQRLLIARALAADPEILILDDASSALDYATDAALRRTLRENRKDTTTVLVAQRISSLRHADLIFMLQDGKVIGMGNHEQMIQDCPEYRFLAQIQMGEGKEGA